MKDTDKAKEQLINELIEMRRHIAELGESETELKQAEETLRLSHRFLEIANRHTETTSLLKELVTEVQGLSGCAAVGVRILDEEGNIPYEAYVGFSQKFYESESPLSIKTDRCMCINVIKGETDPVLPVYTEGGSFYINSTTRFLATLSEEEKAQIRTACNEFGYESVALVPIRERGRIIGLIHVADPRENMIPLEIVQLLEGAAIHLGTAVQRVRAEEKIKEALEEKDVLLKEIHHRVKNNLQIVASLLNLQSEYIEDTSAAEVFKESQERVQSIALVHEKAYQSGNLMKIDFAGYMQDLTDELMHSYGVSPETVKLKVDVSDVVLAIDAAIPCGLIITELVSNCLKHAFPADRKGEIRIDLHPDEDNRVALVVSDNGVGFPQDLDFREARSLGLRIVNALVGQLKGTIELDRSGGTKFRITFAAEG